MLQVVQFLHPGQEHGHDAHDQHYRSWNSGPHKRKFLVSEGSYVDQDGTVASGGLTFWGEWEPPSSVKSLRQPNDDPLYPKWLHHPLLPSKIPTPQGQSTCCGGCQGGSYQNTDPFVFGDAFKYVVCQQYSPSKMTPTKLARLDRGSIVLFGSKGHQGNISFFQVDTVFVVGDYLEYDTQDADALFDDRVSSLYLQIVYRMAFPEPTDYPMKLRLYFGATYAHPIHGMYSFVPARVLDGQDVGFPRIRLHDRPYISNNLSLKFKSTESHSLAENHATWSELRQLTRDSGCVEAISLQHP
ncbi:MAG TPA: hypothetical protein DIW48_02085 [Sphaerochaeta sp.]|nr:hypothetical protein [Sphaerochaeta sp.]